MWQNETAQFYAVEGLNFEGLREKTGLAGARRCSQSAAERTRTKVYSIRVHFFQGVYFK